MVGSLEQVAPTDLGAAAECFLDLFRVKHQIGCVPAGTQLSPVEETMQEVQLQDGTKVYFSTHSGGELDSFGVGDKVVSKLSELSRTGAKVLQEVVENVRAVLAQVSPDSLEVEIGLTLSQEGSVVIASAKAEANISIRASWEKR